MTPRKPRPHKRRGRKPGTKLTDAQKAAIVKQGTGRGEVCPECRQVIPGHLLTCSKVKLPKKKS